MFASTKAWAARFSVLTVIQPRPTEVVSMALSDCCLRAQTGSNKCFSRECIFVVVVFFLVMSFVYFYFWCNVLYFVLKFLAVCFLRLVIYIYIYSFFCHGSFWMILFFIFLFFYFFRFNFSFLFFSKSSNR